MKIQHVAKKFKVQPHHHHDFRGNEPTSQRHLSVHYMTKQTSNIQEMTVELEHKRHQ